MKKYKDTRLHYFSTGNIHLSHGFRVLTSTFRACNFDKHKYGAIENFRSLNTILQYMVPVELLHVAM